jgi:hypothetical protein
MSVLPQPTVSKSGGFQTESGIFTNFNDLYRFFQPKRIKTSLSSPPLAKDVGECELVLDKTALRIYTKVDGSLRYWSLT